MRRREHDTIGSMSDAPFSPSISEWKAFFSTSFDPCFLIGVYQDGTIRIEDVNHAWEAATGIPAAAAIGSSPAAALPPDIAALALDRLRRVAASGETTSFEEPLKFPSGERVWRTQIHPLRSAHGRIILVCTARDLTVDIEQKRAAAEQAAFEKKLQQAQRLESLGILAGGIAHDFNNLLTGILGSASLLRLQPPVSSSALTHIAQIEHAAQRAAEFCRQMLAYAGKGRFAVQKVELGELVRDTLPLVELTVSKRAEVTLRLAPSTAAINADVTQLRQVVMNLVLNGAEALEGKGGSITITTGEVDADAGYVAQAWSSPDLAPGRYVFLEVRDTGSGMSPEVQSRIFEPFFTTKFSGRGLGLSAVIGIVRGHGGAVRVCSEEGKGTAFKLLFPAVQGSPERSEVAPTNGKFRGEGTVLVIDDESIVRGVIVRMLAALGFEVVEAVDGKQGIEEFAAQHARIPAVLMDLSMPEMDGEDAFREIRRIAADVPVLFMSGYDAQDALSRFADTGRSRFIQKPFSMDALAAALQALLG
jgi:PAS domain S-box-containing protein